jgi:hypothetical protein
MRANIIPAADFAAAREAAANDIEWSLFEVFCLANALAAAPVGLDQIGIDEENRKEILTYLADRVRFAAQKSLDLWKTQPRQNVKFPRRDR